MDRKSNYMSNNFFIVACVFSTAVKLLQIRYHPTIGVYKHTRHRLIGLFTKYALDIGSGAMIYIPIFITISQPLRSSWRGYTDTKAAWCLHKPTFIFPNKKSRLRRSCTETISLLDKTTSTKNWTPKMPIQTVTSPSQQAVTSGNVLTGTFCSFTRVLASSQLLTLVTSHIYIYCFQKTLGSSKGADLTVHILSTFKILFALHKPPIVCYVACQTCNALQGVQLQMYKIYTRFEYRVTWDFSAALESTCFPEQL